MTVKCMFYKEPHKLFIKNVVTGMPLADLIKKNFPKYTKIKN